jgi:hypothetical protein
MQVIHGVAERLEPEDYREGQEKKADNFIPEGPGWFDDGWRDMADKLAAVSDRIPLQHNFILSDTIGAARASCSAVKLPIKVRVVLVKPGALHYNRSGWKAPERWNVGAGQRIPS